MFLSSLDSVIFSFKVDVSLANKKKKTNKTSTLKLNIFKSRNHQKIWKKIK